MSKNLLIVSMLCLSTMIFWQSYPQSFQPKSGSQNELSQVIGRLQPGSLVRLKAQDLGTVEATFLRSSDGKLIIEKDQTDTTISMESIETIWVRRSAVGKGAMVGAIVFGVLGFGSGLLLDALCKGFDESEEPTGCPESIALGGVAGATGGALLGATIGAASRRWHQIYP